MDADSRQRVQQMRIDAKGDVKTFDAQTRAYVNQMVGKAGGLMKGPVRLRLQGKIAETRAGLVEEQMQLDMAANENRIKTELEFTDSEMAALARQGGTTTPEYLERLDTVTIS